MTSQFSKKQYNNNANKNSYGYGSGKYKYGKLFNKVGFPYVVSVEDLKHINIYISLFFARKIANAELAGRLRNFMENWKILKNDTEILSKLFNRKTSQTLPN